MPRGLRSGLAGTLGAIGALAAWQLAAKSGVVDADAFPSATDTLSAFGGLLGDELFWQAVEDTLQAAIGGFLIALAIGIPVGVLIGLSPRAAASTRVVVEFLKPIPPVVLIPLLLLTMGPSERMGLFLVSFGCLWPILVQTAYGVQDTDPVALDTVRSFRVPPVQRVWRVVLPSAAPFMATGARIAIGAALVIALVSELIGGAPGLGRDILVAQNAGLVAKTYAMVLATGVLGLGLYLLIELLERRTLYWHPSIRGESVL
jgi:ABC-type nitrate/sulfonate/bicarbonate transport system permease component